MSLNPSRSVIRELLIAAAGAAAGLGWRELFARWSRGPALKLYEQLIRHLDINDVLVVMMTDVLFALGTGLILAELFIRIVRPDRYRPEAVAVIAFLASVFTAAQIGDGGASFLLRLPPLWITLLCFGIRVGYGIKAGRKRGPSSI